MTLVARPAPRDGQIVVTGGAGFLGTNIADALARRGNDVLIFDNLSRAHVEENFRWLLTQHPERISARIADVRDVDSLADAIRGARAVIHLAAQVAVTTSLEDPVTDFEVNARGTLNVLESVRRVTPDAPVLFASTNKVYGELLHLKELARDALRYVPNNAAIAEGFDETAPLSLYSPYGCSKGAADQYVLDYARSYGLKTAVLRMSCLYGPHQYGNEDQGWVAHFIISALRDGPISIYGDGYQVRDVLYVDDVVRAYLLALENIDTVRGRAFNLGGGSQNTLSLRELLNWIQKLTGRAPRTFFQDRRPGDQYWYVSNTAAFAKACGWYPRIGVEAGLSQFSEWWTRALPGAEQPRSLVEAAA